MGFKDRIDAYEQFTQFSFAPYAGIDIEDVFISYFEEYPYDNWRHVAGEAERICRICFRMDFDDKDRHIKGLIAGVAVGTQRTAEAAIDTILGLEPGTTCDAIEAFDERQHGEINIAEIRNMLIKNHIVDANNS